MSSEEVLVHKDILTNRSKYIANALSEIRNNAKDKITNVYNLLPAVKYMYFQIGVIGSIKVITGS
jgi:hypothetical protein